MTRYFFPREREFWFYHISASVAVAALTALSALLWSSQAAFNISLALAWLLPFTVAVLCFRWHYQTQQWHQMRMARLVPLTILYGAVAAFLMMLVLVTMLMPFFWSDLINEDKSIAQAPITFITRFILSNSLQLHITVCAWFILYISFSKNREVKERDHRNTQLLANLREAQLSNLSNQLNPHFLFNSLNNIRFLIHENAERAEEAVVALSEILRYALESSKHDKVSIANEITIVERYLQIAKIQHEERLQIDVDLDANLYQFLVPPMILQMLVENAVKHGIDQLRQGGKIYLQATLSEEQIHFSITNDCNDDMNEPVDGLGIGIHNIAQRLRLLYGDNIYFSVHRTPRQFHVKFALPKELAICEQ